jgi:hypothetical protein
MVTPIETRYEGCLFRSRLEARWAVFMDTLGVRWRYEPEGFTLDDGTRYLPDFFVDGIGWIEIKPTADLDDGKWERFCQGSMRDEQFRAYRVTGDIPAPSYDWFPDGLRIDAFFGGMRGGKDEGYAWCLCWDCGKVGIHYEGRGARICRHDLGRDHKGYSSDAARLKVAYIAARSARFE